MDSWLLGNFCILANRSAHGRGGGSRGSRRNLQATPMPIRGLEALRRINVNFIFNASAQSGWINRWNSLRNEGGIVCASQNQVEGHLRMLYSKRARLGPAQPMLRIFFYHYRQLEDPTEDGNFIRWFSLGPEYGITLSF